MAKPEGAPDSIAASRHSSSCGPAATVRATAAGPRLKDKLGTRSVASGEVEFVDAEAFLFSGEPNHSS